jgi:hypothetical protein
MVLPDSRRIPRVLRYSGTTREAHRFRVQGCHLLWPAIPDRSTNVVLDNSHMNGPTTPDKQACLVWAVPRSLAATRRISVLISFPQGTLDVSVPLVGCNEPMYSVRS